MDECICKFLDRLCSEYNRLNNTNLQSSQIDSWYLDKFIGEQGKEIFRKQGFFDKLEPFPNAIKIVKKLNNEHDIIIASKPQNKETSLDKYNWLEEYMPFIRFNQVVLGEYKHLIKADIMIDDCEYYLDLFKENCNGTTICIDREYNKKFKADYRIYDTNWLEIYDIIKKIQS